MKNKTKAWIFGMPFLFLIAYSIPNFIVILFKDLDKFSMLEKNMFVFGTLFVLLSFILMLYYFNKEDDNG